MPDHKKMELSPYRDAEEILNAQKAPPKYRVTHRVRSHPVMRQTDEGWTITDGQSKASGNTPEAAKAAWDEEMAFRPYIPQDVAYELLDALVLALRASNNDLQGFEWVDAAEQAIIRAGGKI